MQLEAKKYIYDIRHACHLILEFIEAKVDPASVERITNYKRLIGLRNVLIHGYADIDDELIWDLLQAHLTLLVKQVNELESD